MKITNLLHFFALLLYFQFSLAFAQNNNPEVELSKWFDNEIGETNIDLSNGVEDIEEFPGYPKGSHKYFASRYFTTGRINYLGQDYYNVSMVYDILEDKVIIMVEDDESNYVVQLLSNRIKNFSINSTNFVRLNHENFKGFFELVRDHKNFKLYRKHRKYAKGRDASGNETAAYIFDEVKPEYVFEFENALAIISEKSDLYTLFPNIREQIRNMLKKDKVMRSAWRKKDMVTVFNKIQDLLSKKNI